MVKKLITFSFAPESIGGFCCICNGVQTVREKHMSKCIPMTKHAFIEAMKDRIKFNELLGIDIREGWQNALKDAIEPFSTMTEECDPQVAADAVAKADVNIRGEDVVSADMETLEKDNEKMITEVEKEVKDLKKEHEETVEAIATEIENSAIDTEKTTKKRKTTKKSKKEPVNDEGRNDTVAPVSADNGCAESDGVSAEEPSSNDNA